MPKKPELLEDGLGVSNLAEGEVPKPSDANPQRPKSLSAEDREPEVPTDDDPPLHGHSRL